MFNNSQNLRRSMLFKECLVIVPNYCTGQVSNFADYAFCYCIIVLLIQRDWGVLTNVTLLSGSPLLPPPPHTHTFSRVCVWVHVCICMCMCAHTHAYTGPCMCKFVWNSYMKSTKSMKFCILHMNFPKHF